MFLSVNRGAAGQGIFRPVSQRVHKLMNSSILTDKPKVNEKQGSTANWP
jgi:hypothetical protein